MYFFDSLRSMIVALHIMKKQVFYSLLFALILIGLPYSCASKPAVEPVVQEQSADNDKLQSLEEKAKGAIARAEAAGAAEISPKLLDEAYLDLRNAQEKDPGQDEGAQRAQYLSAIDKANQAYNEAVGKSRDLWLQTIDNYETDLDELNASLYMPEYDARSRELLRQLRDQIQSGDNEESLDLYQSIIPNVDAVVGALAANLDWLDQLRQEVAGLQGEASRQDLAGESAELEQQGRNAYESAIEHHARGDMQSMEQDLYDARYYLSEALRHSGALDPGKIDTLLKSIQKRLETASKRKVIDSEGNELDIEPWSGDAYLREHPLLEIDSAEPSGQRPRDESELQEPQVSADFFPSTVPDASPQTSQAGGDIGPTLSLLAQPELQDHHLSLMAQAQSFTASWQINAITQSLGDSNMSSTPDKNAFDGENSREGNPFEGSQVSNSPHDSQTPNSTPGTAEGDDFIPLSESQTETADNATIYSQEEPESQTISGRDTALQESAQYVSDDGLQTGKQALLSDAQLLLKQAISSWENGVQARNKNELPKAQHYFEEAARLVDQYNVQYAIFGYYTVRKVKPEDCLWRIAGYADIYGDPFQWKRIYQRNKNLIRIPSLIHPGWRLVIPPAKESQIDLID